MEIAFMTAVIYLLDMYHHLYCCCGIACELKEPFFK